MKTLPGKPAHGVLGSVEKTLTRMNEKAGIAEPLAIKTIGDIGEAVLGDALFTPAGVTGPDNAKNTLGRVGMWALLAPLPDKAVLHAIAAARAESGGTSVAAVMTGAWRGLRVDAKELLGATVGIFFGLGTALYDATRRD